MDDGQEYRTHQSDEDPRSASSRFEQLERTCFVIMPFGKKNVDGSQVDFTAIYKEIFEPAINEAKTPEGKSLMAERTDMDAFSGSINQDMFEYIMYSRLAFADISGFNPNVFYEIGARHSTQESGTVLFRQTGHAIPFDIASIKVFEYDREPADKVEASRTFITNVLSESLKRNRLDSPVRLALRAQWAGEATNASSTTGNNTPALAPNAQASDCADEARLAVESYRKQEVEKFMFDAEEATRLGDLDMAKTNYWGALRFDPLNILARMRLGLTLKQQGRSFEALEEFITITKLEPGYAEAWREKGVVEGLIARTIPSKERKKANWLPDGYDSLRRATRLNPNDFDAWSSLGGVLKNVRGDLVMAREMYAHAAKISHGHPYPLLNALKLEAQHSGKLALAPVQTQLAAAERLRQGQADANPPTDTPWCFFDLAELRLYQGDENGFIEYIKKGIASCTESWQPETARNSLHANLVASGINLPGLSQGIELLDAAIAASSKK